MGAMSVSLIKPNVSSSFSGSPSAACAMGVPISRLAAPSVLMARTKLRLTLCVIAVFIGMPLI